MKSDSGKVENLLLLFQVESAQHVIMLMFMHNVSRLWFLRPTLPDLNPSWNCSHEGLMLSKLLYNNNSSVYAVSIRQEIIKFQNEWKSTDYKLL